MKSPRLECDLVMRGGITSGIVYPKAIAELSKTFDFRSIGGTSAGALAAVFTAAAQYGENRGATLNGLRPFEVLEALPEWLAGKTASRKTRLLAVLQPQPATRPLFDLVIAIIRQSEKKTWVRSLLDKWIEAIPKKRDGGKSEFDIHEKKPRLRLLFDRLSAVIQKKGEPGKSKLEVAVIVAAAVWRLTWNAMIWLIALLLISAILVTYTVGNWTVGAFVVVMVGYLITAAFLRILFTPSVAHRLSDGLSPVGAFIAGFFLTGFTLLSVQAGGLFVGHLLGVDFGLPQPSEGGSPAPPGSLLGPIFLASLPLFFGSFLIATGWAVVAGLKEIQKVLPNNGYGLCTGMTSTAYGNPPGDDCEPDALSVLDRVTARDDAPDGIAPLTEWMHCIVQALAYGDQREGHTSLTFGDLWGSWKSDDSRGQDAGTGKEKDKISLVRCIDLQYMTTDITRGISGRLPFLARDHEELFMREADLDAYLPKALADIFRRQPSRCGRLIYNSKEVFTLYRIPAPQDFPIVLAARMSLSFPILLSAVPLYLHDTTPQKGETASQEKEDGAVIAVHKLWFSDGGLTSNFPIHFFDAPLPNRPTFAINLAPSSVRFEGRPLTREDEKPQDPHDYVYMPVTKEGGGAPRVNDFESPANDVAPEARIIKFLEALFDTARNWADSEQMLMPGYRERIVHVKLEKNEGGLNLDMPPEIIKAVGERGALAGKFLVNRFNSPSKPDPIPNGEHTKLDWDYHRRQRYHVCMAALEHYLERFERAWDRSKQSDYHRHFAYGHPDFADELFATNSRRAPLFKNKRQATYAHQMTKELHGLLSKVRAGNASNLQTDLRFDGKPPSATGSPRPKATVRLLPAGCDPLERD